MAPRHGGTPDHARPDAVVGWAAEKHDRALIDLFLRDGPLDVAQAHRRTVVRDAVRRTIDALQAGLDGDTEDLEACVAAGSHCFGAALREVCRASIR